MRADRKDELYQPDLPPVHRAPHLLTYLWEIGPTMSAGMGSGPITHGELEAWQRNTGITLAPWEARVIRDLSRDYISESSKAEKRDCPEPWQSDEFVDAAPDHSAADRMKAAIRGLANL